MFPIVDISYITTYFQNSDNWKNDEKFQTDKEIMKLVEELRDGFQTWGFLYITGHQVPDDLIKAAFEKSKEFFESPSDFKRKYTRDKSISDGFVGAENEVFDPTKPLDKKEAFDFRPNTGMSLRLAEEMPEAVDALSKLFVQCKELINKFLRLLAVALGIDTEHYIKLHSEIGKLERNGTSLRTLFYPSIEPAADNILEDDRRIREHTDYGTITLLFQDQSGGLEVQSPSGEFVPAKPIPGSIVINAGDLLYNWSNGKYRATIHRVLLPKDEHKRSKSRQSMAFFCHPNYDVTIKSNDGNANAYEHLTKRFNETIVVN